MDFVSKINKQIKFRRPIDFEICNVGNICNNIRAIYNMHIVYEPIYAIYMQYIRQRYKILYIHHIV